MKPGTEYSLADLGANFKSVDARGDETPRFGIRPGFDYKLEVLFDSQPPHTAEILIHTHP